MSGYYVRLAIQLKHFQHSKRSRIANMNLKLLLCMTLKMRQRCWITFSWCIKQDVDIIQGHNVNRFDNTYMLERYNHIFKDFPRWGRFCKEKSNIKVSLLIQIKKAQINSLNFIYRVVL